MINNKRPTRAEVSDIANAIYDGTSCIMLSGETAIGKYPEDAVKTMSKVALETEKHIEYFKEHSEVQLDTIADFVSKGAVAASLAQNIKLIFAYTTSGLTAGLISRFRPTVDIIGATPNEKVYRQMELRWGVKPVLTPVYNTTDEMFKIANDIVKKNKLARVGDLIVVTCGTPKQNGGTNLIKIIQVK